MSGISLVNLFLCAVQVFVLGEERDVVWTKQNENL